MTRKGGFGATATLLVASLVSSALAQTGSTYVTIEAWLAVSEAVHVGTITSITTLPAVRDGIVPYEITVRVDETIKGAAFESLTLEVPYFPSELLHAYSRDRTEFLWFLTDDKDLTKFDKTGSSIGWNWHRLGNDPPEGYRYQTQRDGINLFSLDLTLLDSREKILATARRFASSHPGVQQLMRTLDLPSIAGRRNYVGNGFLVPVVPELEAVAQRLLVNAEEILAESPYAVSGRRAEIKGDIERVRKSGIRALAPFSSADNVALLQLYVDDPSPEVRRVALDVLAQWGVTED